MKTKVFFDGKEVESETLEKTEEITAFELQEILNKGKTIMIFTKEYRAGKHRFGLINLNLDKRSEPREKNGIIYVNAYFDPERFDFGTEGELTPNEGVKVVASLKKEDIYEINVFDVPSNL